MPARWKKPNRDRAKGKAFSRRPRRYKPDNPRLKHIEANLDDYRKATRYICELVRKIDI